MSEVTSIYVPKNPYGPSEGEHSLLEFLKLFANYAHRQDIISFLTKLIP